MPNFLESTKNAVGQSHEDGLATIAEGIVESFGVNDDEAFRLAPRARHGINIWSNLCVLHDLISIGFISKLDATEIVSRLIAEKWSYKKLSQEISKHY